MLNDENSYLFKFAWKSIRRNAGRSFFIGLSVSLAVFIAVWVVAFFDGMNHQIEKAVVNTNTGYFQIQDATFSKTTDSANPAAFDELPTGLFDSPVIAYSPELVLDSNISTPEGATGLVAIGIDPQLHSKFLRLHNRMIEGEFVTSQDEHEIVIGEELANLFRFKVGEQLVLNYQDQSGDLRSEILHIKGIYHYNGKGFEKRFVYLSQRTWQILFFNQDKGKLLFNRVAIKSDGLQDMPLLQKRLGRSDFTLKTWKNLNPEMAVVLEFHDGMIKFFFLIIGITIMMTILTPVQMLWQERLKELRMLNIIGVSSSKFWKIGIFEVIQMILSSGIFSSVMLILIIGIQSQTGIDFGWINDGVAIERAGIKLPKIIYPKLTVEQISITFAFVLFILSVSYIWSIHRTLRKLEAPL